MNKSISLKRLNIGYACSKGNHLVAKNLNATLFKGEMTCLLGPNGTGKSTLMKTICGFLNALSGEIKIEDTEISILDERMMAKLVSIVLTEKISIPNATVYELVAYGRSPFTGFLGRLTAKDKLAIEHSIELCGINHKKHNLLSALSDGERQKATIAKALAQDTPIILLDEPTAFLDLPARVEIMQLLRKLAVKMQKTVLMSTHDLDLALQMADKLWLLQNNGVITGSPEDLLLQNAFQAIFSKGGVEFDNKTGLFKVAYKHQAIFPVLGHGFEYVLLRRALMRKGIKPVKANGRESLLIKITNNCETPYSILVNDTNVLSSASVEQTIFKVIQLIDSKEASNKQPVSVN